MKRSQSPLYFGIEWEQLRGDTRAYVVNIVEE